MQNIDLAEFVETLLATQMSNMHFALPGTVTKYTASNHTCSVKVGVKRPVPTAVEGEFVTETIPELTDVRVVWPGGNGDWFAPGLAVGDGVLLVISDLDPSTWLRNGEASDPGDLRKSSAAHAFAIPGCRTTPQAQAVAMTPGLPVLKVATANVGGNSDAAALASVVDAILGAIASCTPAGTEPGLAAIKLALAPYLTSASTVLSLGG
jgi:hypothetical protein